MKLCIFCYVPPPPVGHPETFLRHVRSYKTSSDLLIYSDHPWPDVIKLKGAPDMARDATFPDGQRNKFAMANVTFFTGLLIARAKGYSHAIVLEADCRVNRDNWDGVMWDEYFSLGRPVIGAGTLAVYNPCNSNPEGERKWNALLRRNTEKNFPVVTYGFKGAGECGPCCVFPNGALAIYSLDWMAKFFDLERSITEAAKVTAWDMAIGFKTWEIFGADSYELMGMLESVFSGFGNVVTTEEQRIGMLMRGDVVAVHQIKNDWVP